MSIEEALSALDLSLAVGALLVVFLRLDKRIGDVQASMDRFLDRLIDLLDEGER